MTKPVSHRIIDKYQLDLPRSAKLRQVINTAIREHYAGGAEVLDAIDRFRQMVHSMERERRDGDPAIDRLHEVASIALEWFGKIKERMADEVMDSVS